MVLTVSFLSFDEPERGRFDIAHSVVANHSQMDRRSIAKRPEKHGYAMSSARSMPMEVLRDASFSDHMAKQTHFQNYWKSLMSMFQNDTARWILLAACLKTQESIAMSLFTGEYFRIYPGRDRDFQNYSMLAQLIGAFICTILTAWICDYYDLMLGHYMTKAWICIGTTLISIPCCLLIYLVQQNFFLSMSGVFIEYLLSTCWG